MIKHKLKPGKILLFLGDLVVIIPYHNYHMKNQESIEFLFQENVLYLIITEYSMEGLDTRWILKEEIDFTMAVMQIGTKYYLYSIYYEFDWDSKSLKYWQNHNQVCLGYQYNVSQNEKECISFSQNRYITVFHFYYT